MKRIFIAGILLFGASTANSAVWTNGPVMLERCADHAAEAHGTDIYVFGGWNSTNTYLATVQKYDTVSGQWSLLSPMPVGRTNAASVVVGDRIYVIGGLVSYYTASADVLTFDPLTHSWGTAASLPEPLVSARAVYADNRIWVIGGSPTFSPGDASTTVYLSNDLVASGGVLTGWTTHAHPLPAPLVYHDAAVLQGIIYVTGGGDNLTYGSGVTSDAIYAMDPAVGTWDRAGTLPEPVLSHAGVGRGEWVFTFGGYHHPDYVAATSVFSTLISRVTPGTPVTLPTLGMRAVVVGSLVYVLGGYDETYWEGSNECRIYDAAEDGFTDPIPYDGNPCPDILGIYFDEGAGSNCGQSGGFFFAHLVITNPSGATVQGLEFGYQILVTSGVLDRLSESLPPGATNYGDSSDWLNGDYFLGWPTPLPGGGQSVVCVSWWFYHRNPSDDREVSFYLSAANGQSIPDGYPAYTDGFALFPLGIASGGADVPVAVANGACLDPATVTISTQPAGLDPPWSLEVPGTPHDLSGTGDAFFENLPAGAYTITWGSVEGYRPPAAATETLEVAFGGAAVFSGEYDAIIADVVDVSQPMASLQQNVPNPFNPATRLSFALERAGQTRLAVFDAKGRLVRTLVDGHFAAGPHEVSWDGRDGKGRLAPAGVYLYRLESGEFTQTRRMMLLK